MSIPKQPVTPSPRRCSSHVSVQKGLRKLGLRGCQALRALSAGPISHDQTSDDYDDCISARAVPRRLLSCPDQKPGNHQALHGAFRYRTIAVIPGHRRAQDDEERVRRIIEELRDRPSSVERLSSAVSQILLLYLCEILQTMTTGPRSIAQRQPQIC